MAQGRIAQFRIYTDEERAAIYESMVKEHPRKEREKKYNQICSQNGGNLIDLLFEKEVHEEKEACRCLYMFPLTGEACDRLLKDTSRRNRHRHLAIHAESEEGMLTSGQIGMESAVMMRRLPKLKMACRIDGCDFREEVWNIFKAQNKHEKEKHGKKGRNKAQKAGQRSRK